MDKEKLYITQLRLHLSSSQHSQSFNSGCRLRTFLIPHMKNPNAAITKYGEQAIHAIGKININATSRMCVVDVLVSQNMI